MCVLLWKKQKIRIHAENSKDLLDGESFFQYNRSDVFQQKTKIEGGGFRYEDDISAKKETEI